MESSISSSYRRRPSHPYLLSPPHRHGCASSHLCKRWTSIKDDWTDQPPGYSLGQHNLANGTNNNLTWHISFLLPLIDVCLLSIWPPLTTSLQPYKVCCIYHLPRKLYNFKTFQSFIGNMINDLYTTLTITYYTICTLIRGKEDRSVGRGVFFTNILLDIEVLARRSRFVLHLLHCCWKCINRKLYNFLIGKFSFRDWLTLLEEMLKKGRLNFLYYHCIVV